MNYENLTEITVKSQEELEAIPLNFKGRIYIEFGTCFEPAIVKNKYVLPVIAWENSAVEARENSSVEARENSSVKARGNSSVKACDNSSVEAWGNSSVIACSNSSVIAWGNSSVIAWGNSSVIAWGNSSVIAWGNSSVEARENSSVKARGNSAVEAWGNSSVIAWENSSVEARENSSVEAWENSAVEARENSSVEARENSSVKARGNVQVVDCLRDGKIQISGNARIVHNPKNIHEFMNFYAIKHTKTKAIFYKAVRKLDNKKYCSNYNNTFVYEIGKTAKEPNIDTDTDETCRKGIHISHLNWALDYGRDWTDLAILEVETKIDDIVCPINNDGKVRTSKVKVLREVPLEECGLYGKILAKRRAKINDT